MIDEQQDELLDVHKGLKVRHPYLKDDDPSKERELPLEREIELLWEMVMVYEKYSEEERNLRIKAVEALRKHEEQPLGKVQEICLPPEEPHEESAKSSRWSKPRVKTMRVPAQGNQRVEDDIEADDRRLADMERRGIELDREHKEAMDYSEAQQQVNNRRFQELTRENDKAFFKYPMIKLRLIFK